MKCDDNSLVLARVISREKAGRAFVNGTLAPLSVLAELGRMWIDFHGPREPQKLFSAKTSSKCSTTTPGDKADRDEYLLLYRERAKILGEIDALKNSKKLSPDEIEYLKAK